MNRAEHLDWAKQRAFEQIDRYSGFAGWVSFKHDLAKHDELATHSAISLGDDLLKMAVGPGVLTNPDVLLVLDLPGPFNMRKFIEGFN